MVIQKNDGKVKNPLTLKGRRATKPFYISSAYVSKKTW